MEVVSSTETKHGEVTITFKRATLRYLDDFTKLTCSPDLLKYKLFPNAKEITESFAAYNAVRKNLTKYGYPLDDPNILLVSIGDGGTPRTAATFAFRSAWNCVSIDPNLHDRYNYSMIDRLTIFPHKVEEVTLPTGIIHRDNKVIIVAVHSHVDLNEGVRLIQRSGIHVPIAVVAIPCCVEQTLQDEGEILTPDITYDDYGIHSPKRTIHIWREVNHENYYPY